MISKVVQVGKNVKDIEVGMMVYPYPRLAKGDPKRVGTVGGFSEYVLIPDAELDKQVYDIPTRKAFLKYSEKSGEKITPYQLRHSFATLFLKNGGDVFSLQHLMAHADLRTTKRYTELYES